MVNAIVMSQDFDIISLCEDLGDELGVKMENKPDLANFLLALQEKDYQVALFDCTHMDATGLRWVKVIKKTRPKIPLIIFSDEVDQKMGGKIYHEGIFYLCVRPVRREVIKNAFSAAISFFHSHTKN
jgi:DNA-binding NtrC family response regulator